MKRALLLKVAVTTVWVEVDDETGLVEERVGSQVIVPAPEWPGFYDAWVADFELLQKRVEAESAILHSPSEPPFTVETILTERPETDPIRPVPADGEAPQPPQAVESNAAPPGRQSPQEEIE